MRMISILGSCLLMGSALVSCTKKPVIPEKLAYEIVAVKFHDPTAYTQGLQWIDGRLWESTGNYNRSSVRELDEKDGKVLRKRSLPAEVFGEGLTMHGKELWVYTWKEKTAYVLDPENFHTLRTYPYEGEGWGMTSNGRELITSDGSSTLKFRNPKDMSVVSSLEVTEQGRPVKFLNELELVGSHLFANVYTTNRIARIDLKTGEVTGWIDLSELKRRQPASADVLNGIAYQSKSGHFIVTGKHWPEMFEIKVPDALK